MNIKAINYSDLPKDFIERAKKERLTFLEGEGIYYWGAYEKAQLIGCTCLVTFKNGHGKIKSNYVLPDFRGQGIFNKLNSACLDFAKKQGIKNITLNCLANSVNLHIKAGAEIYMEKKTIKYLVYRFE